ncbi:MAG: DUF4340 domain-containing protein [Polyangiaceae bacterium]|nr:DUF4340 domain-containing protein [Polyangiaceae bacterium]
MSGRLARHWPTLALAALAVGVTVAVVATRGAVTTSELEARDTNVLGSFREDDLTRIEIEWVGKPRVILERGRPDDAGDAPWWLREPVREEADPVGMREWLDVFEFLRAVRRIKPEEVDRAAFGLDSPRARFELQMGKVRYRLALGKEAVAPPGAAYLEVSGDGAPRPGIVIVPRDAVTELEPKLDDLRERRLVPYLSTELARLEKKGAGGDWQLERAEAGAWRISGGSVVDRDALDRVLLSLARTTADPMIELAAATEALRVAREAGQKVVEVRQVPRDPARVAARVEVGGKCPAGKPGAVAIRHEPEPLAGCVPESVLAGYALGAEELRDRTPFTLRRDEIEKLVITRGEARLDLARRESGFVLNAPKQGEVELEPGNQRLAALVDAQGVPVEAPDLEKLGLEPPRGRVSVTSVGDAIAAVKEEHVQVGKPLADGRTHVRRESDGVVLELSREAARAFAPDATLIRGRRLLDFRASELRRFEVTAPGGRQALARTPGGAWVLELPSGAQPDGSAATEIAELVSRLECERWVSDDDDGSHGLAAPRLRVEISWEAGDAGVKSAALSVGGPVAGGAFASLSGEPGVMALPQRSIDTLELVLADRAALVLPAAEVVRLELETKERKRVLVAKGETFVDESAEPLSPEAVRRIVEVLSAFTAEAAVHWGPARPDEGLAEPLLRVRVERRPGAGVRSAPIAWRLGAGDSWRGITVHYARAEGVDATYAVARGKVRELMAALQAKGW